MPHDETWTIRKPAVESDGGIVTAQHHMAARAGADTLARGGNAIDAAITTAFALSAVEPWMSGLGGCGCMLVYLASEKRTFALEFGVRAPLALDLRRRLRIEFARVDILQDPGPSIHVVRV